MTREPESVARSGPGAASPMRHAVAWARGGVGADSRARACVRGCTRTAPRRWLL